MHCTDSTVRRAVQRVLACCAQLASLMIHAASLRIVGPGSCAAIVESTPHSVTDGWCKWAQRETTHARNGRAFRSGLQRVRTQIWSVRAHGRRRKYCLDFLRHRNAPPDMDLCTRVSSGPASLRIGLPRKAQVAQPPTSTLDRADRAGTRRWKPDWSNSTTCRPDT
eukprot:2598220-Prymnesium_polylepis.2